MTSPNSGFSNFGTLCNPPAHVVNTRPPTNTRLAASLLYSTKIRNFISTFIRYFGLLTKFCFPFSAQLDVSSGLYHMPAIQRSIHNLHCCLGGLLTWIPFIEKEYARIDSAVCLVECIHHYSDSFMRNRSMLCIVVSKVTN